MSIANHGSTARERISGQRYGSKPPKAGKPPKRYGAPAKSAGGHRKMKTK